MKKLIVSILIIFVLSFVSADVVSVNSGGSNQIVITPDAYVEGFFSCVPTTCSLLGYTCGTWSDNCGNTINCGSCPSGYACPFGTCAAYVPGGGGAAPPGVTIPKAVELSPTEFNIKMVINTNKPEIIKVTNPATMTKTYTVRQENLDTFVILENTSVTVQPGETKDFNVIFVAPSTPGIYAGKIVIGGQEILVTLNVRTQLLLFDSNIVVLNKDYKIAQGDKLRTKVTLVPLGDPERLDVTLKYSVRDYKDKVYLTKSETLLVQDKIDIYRDFDTGILPVGNYIVGLELIYSNGVAPSSAHFEIIEKKPVGIWAGIMIFLIMLIIIIILVIIGILIKRRLKEREEE